MARGYPMGSIATGDLSTQAPWLGSCLLSCSSSAPLLHLRNHSHKAKQLLFHTPIVGHTLASLPKMPFPSGHLQTPWKSWSDFISPRQLCFTHFPLYLIPLLIQSITAASLFFWVFLLLSPSHSCHWFSVVLTDYGNFEDWVSFIPSS